MWSSRWAAATRARVFRPGPRYLDWPLADPAGQDLETVRAIRQDIADHVLDLLKELLRDRADRGHHRHPRQPPRARGRAGAHRRARDRGDLLRRRPGRLRAASQRGLRADRRARDPDHLRQLRLRHRPRPRRLRLRVHRTRGPRARPALGRLDARAHRPGVEGLHARAAVRPAASRSATTDVHLVHGSPRKVNEYLFEDKPARLYERLATAETDQVLVFGHTHKPWVHEYGGVLFVNCGSVGKPKDGDPRGRVRDPRARRTAGRRHDRARRLRRRSRRARGRRRRTARPSTPTSSWPPREPHRPSRRLLAEFLGSALLAALVIGSGIAAQQLSNDPGLQLLENAAATAAGLFAIILMFGPVSGGHFNPVVSSSTPPSADSPGATRSPTSPPRSPAASPARSSPTSCSTLPRSASRPPIAPAPHTSSPRSRYSGLLLVIFALVRTGRVDRPRGGRRLHRRRLLVHQLHQLRQPRHQHRPDLLRHLRRHRPRLGPSFIVAQLAGGYRVSR